MPIWLDFKCNFMVMPSSFIVKINAKLPKVNCPYNCRANAYYIYSNQLTDDSAVSYFWCNDKAL